MNASSPVHSAAQVDAAGRAAPSRLSFLIALTVLLGACYYPMLRMTAVLIWTSDDMAHGLFAPIVAGYLAWISRDAVLGPASPSGWGVPVLLLAAAFGVAATLATSSTLSRFAFLGSLAGSLLLLGGGAALRRFIFPLSLLLFTFPLPSVLYGELTQPLQLLATRLSELALEALGFSVMRDGNVLYLAHMQLSVVEACSGLRSLVTLLFFSLVYVYFLEPRFWVRSVLVLASFPAAIAVNMLRITATGVLGKFNPAWTKGTLHDSLGWGGFFVGFALVYLVHLGIGRLWPAPGREKA